MILTKLDGTSRGREAIENKYSTDVVYRRNKSARLYEHSPRG